MGSIIEKIKKFLGIKPKYELLVSGKSEESENRESRFRESVACEGIGLTETQEIESALERIKELATQSIEANAVETNYDKEKFQGIRDEGARRRKAREAMTGYRLDYNAYFEIELVTGLKPKVKDIIVKLYEVDNTILDEDRTEELIETIKKQTGIDEKNPDKTFEQWAIEQLYTPAKLGKRHGIPTIERPEVDLKPIIEAVMPIDEFIKCVIECRVKGMQAFVKDIPALGEKFGIQYAMLRAINPHCTLPEELQGKFTSVEDYQQRTALGIQDLTNSVIEEGTLSKQFAYFRQKFAESQLFAKNKILAYSPEQYKELIMKMVEEDRETGNENSGVTRLASDLMKKYMMALRNGVDSISKNNNKSTWFQMYIEEDNGDVTYHYYQGKIPNEKYREEQ